MSFIQVSWKCQREKTIKYKHELQCEDLRRLPSVPVYFTKRSHDLATARLLLPNYLTSSCCDWSNEPEKVWTHSYRSLTGLFLWVTMAITPPLQHTHTDMHKFQPLPRNPNTAMFVGQWQDGKMEGSGVEGRDLENQKLKGGKNIEEGEKWSARDGQ